MKEFLILANSRELTHIESSDIWYISADGNYSHIFLTNGNKILVTKQLGDVKKAIDTYLPHYRGDFHRIGQSLIINRIYLFSINLTEQQLVLSDRRAEGYLVGYSAGYSDCRSGKPSYINLDSTSKGKVLNASKDSLKRLKEEIEKIAK
ncbi:MAG: hypothetical protein IJR26_09765 [Bacteroidales bacterium]|nr:hypothetical protein [Bacteroidales bacterium]